MKYEEAESLIHLLQANKVIDAATAARIIEFLESVSGECDDRGTAQSPDEGENHSEDNKE